MLAIVLIGFAAGMESDLVAFLVARYFGMRSYARIYGILYIIYGGTGSLSAGVYGRYYDVHHSCSGILTISACVLVASAALILTRGRYRYLAHPLRRDPVPA